MEADPDFRSFLLVEEGTGCVGWMLACSPNAMGLWTGAPAAACTAGGLQWSLWALLLQITISHGYSELLPPQSCQHLVTLGCNPGPASKFGDARAGTLSVWSGARRRAQGWVYSTRRNQGAACLAQNNQGTMTFCFKIPEILRKCL